MAMLSRKAVSSAYDEVKEETLAASYLRRKRLQKPKKGSETEGRRRRDAPRN